MDSRIFMGLALEEASKALETNDVPIGAVSVQNGKIIARAHNEKEKRSDPTCHAELLVLKKTAKKLKTWRLNGVEIFTTLEPCPMCAGALVLARVKSLTYGAKDEKSGACGSIMNLADHKILNHRIKVKGGIMEKECSGIIRDFFGKLRRGAEDKGKGYMVNGKGGRRKYH